MSVPQSSVNSVPAFLFMIAVVVTALASMARTWFRNFGPGRKREEPDRP
jgi:hypothetical protein